MDKTNKPDAVHVDEDGMITAVHRLARGDYMQPCRAGIFQGPCIVTIRLHPDGVTEYHPQDI